MLKDTEKYENQENFSYKDYRKRVKKGSNKDLTVFISVFIIGLLIILGFVKILSPNVDVSIAGEEEYAQFEDESGEIDDRLKNLQMEDSAKVADDEEMFSPELDERVVLPKKIGKTVGEMEAEMLDAKAQEEKAKEPSKEVKEEQKTAPVENQPTHVVNAKVVVGYYATEKQAEVAKSIIQDAGLGVTPMVKNMGEYYTLQVGSYSSVDKAQQAANGLLKSNFPARVITE